jgi:hypothetical protein
MREKRRRKIEVTITERKRCFEFVEGINWVTENWWRAHTLSPLYVCEMREIRGGGCWCTYYTLLLERESVFRELYWKSTRIR